MTRQEVWAVYERGARAHQREFVVMWIDTGVPIEVDPGGQTQRMEAVQP